MTDSQQNKKQKKKLTIEEEAERNEKLLDYAGEDQVVSAAVIWKRESGKYQTKQAIRLGINGIDTQIGGGAFPGQLVTISGPTGEGKTTLCRSFTRSFIEQGVHPLWFSYEETPLQFLSKFPNGSHDYFYMPSELLSNQSKWIEQRILESKIKFGTKAVLVDHLHFLIDFYMRNSTLEIGSIVRKMKLLAIELDICFFLIAHIGKVDKSRELQQGDIRDSALIEAESDTVIYTWRTAIDGKEMNYVKVTKNRETGIRNFKIPLRYSPEKKMLFEVKDEKEEKKQGRLI